MRRTATMREAIVVPIVVALSIMLAGCGSSSKAAAPKPTAPAETRSPATAAPTTGFTATTLPKACDAVPKTLAETVIGRPLGDGVDEGRGEDCQYTGDPNGPVAQVEVYIGDGAKQFYSDESKVLQHTFTNVPGLGDEAHEEDYAIFFRKGSTWAGIHLVSLDDASTFKARLEDAARALAAKL